MTAILTFDQAVSRCSSGKRCPHILLGNGFSRALRNDIFAYDALLSGADFSGRSSLAREAFDVLRTTDFEVAIRGLRTAAQLARLYASTHPGLALQMDKDADGLREVLVQTIAAHHPDHPLEITDDQYAACRHFLSHFDRIYTFNYDLLLYWALMHDEAGPDVPHDDGFRTSNDNPDAEYVTWDIEKTDRQNIFYLHGGLHIFDAGSELLKYTWSRTGVRLIEQIRAALHAHLYPVFVSEGKSDQKLDRIRHNDMLSRGYRSFAKITGTLFVYGHSLAANDEHFLKLVERGKVSRLFVSIFGDVNSDDNRRIVARAAALATARTPRRPLEVAFFDAPSARVWG
jgi:hypothetical protein